MAVRKSFVWNGSAWAECTPFVWNGSAWAIQHTNVWNGSGWLEISNWVNAGPYPTVAMTSTNTPTPFQCAASSNYNTSTYREYRAFNRDNSNDYCWLSSSSDSAPWLSLYMGGAALINIYIVLTNRNSTAVAGIYAANIQGSNDNTNWMTIGDISGRNGDTVNYSSTHYCWNSDDAYTWVRICPTNWRGKPSYVAIGEMTVYGQVAT